MKPMGGSPQVGETLAKHYPRRLGMECFHARLKRMQPGWGLSESPVLPRVKPEPCYWIWAILSPWLLLPLMVLAFTTWWIRT